MNVLVTAGEWLAQNLVWIKAASVVFSAVLLVGIIYFARKGMYAFVQTTRWMDILGVGNVPRYRALRGWRHILKHLRSLDPDEWRKALEEADMILDEILKMSGYQGVNLDERLRNITSAQIANIEELRQAHSLAKQVKESADVALDKTTVDEAIYVYRKAFQEFRLLE